jgi:hypothetical protein
MIQVPALARAQIRAGARSFIHKRVINDESGSTKKPFADRAYIGRASSRHSGDFVGMILSSAKPAE